MKDITIVIINIQMAIVLSQVSFSIEHFGLNILNNRNEFQNTENHIVSFAEHQTKHFDILSIIITTLCRRTQQLHI